MSAAVLDKRGRRRTPRPNPTSLEVIRRSDPLTTGQAAKVCRVACRTLTRWIDTGMLEGRRMPGVPERRDRRVSRSALLAFMREYGIPTDLLEEKPFRMLLVSRDELLSAAVVSSIAQVPLPTECATAVDFFSAGTECERLQPDVVICDFALGRDWSELLRHELRKREEQTGRKPTKLVALVGEDESDQQPGWDSVFKRPFDTELLAAKVAGMRGGQ